MSDEEVEYDSKTHSYVAGRHSSFQEAHEYILKLAGQRYTEGRDDLARELREAARFLGERVKLESAELDRHIKRGETFRQRASERHEKSQQLNLRSR